MTCSTCHGDGYMAEEQRDCPTCHGQCWWDDDTDINDGRWDDDPSPHDGTWSEA